eukprot:CAMPEP_0197081520 /NCGR_PEP_ID=MMETSP1384-20130603/214674_1 /TAXON_ID=29189 /ORGANISM="Ammonia sp." /LENGTH=771 /DNA_ID=CAMNT_0042520415 /DNA_START=23 /DNA_END=2338 /DNA_ORIENTATION=-
MTENTEDLRQRAEQYNHQLLTSEDIYVNELETIVTQIVRPLENAAVRCKIPGGTEEVKQVFKYISSMLHFHENFLSVIREAISVIPDLYKYINFITMYDDYLHHYDRIINTFASWRSMEFREFIMMRLKHNTVKKNLIDRLDSLPWYLYRPFDRIKEYYRFLRDIEKITPKGHEEYGMVNKTIAKLRPLYKKIKQNEDRLQKKTRLLEVQVQIHGYNKSLVDDNRYFVYNRHCQMKRRGLPGKKYKQIQVYLFNDLFLWVSARGRFKGSYSFYKENLEVEIPKNSKKGDAVFSIGLATEKHKRLIVCADDLQRNKLMETILSTYKRCQKDYIKVMNGSDQAAIKQMQRKKRVETTIRDAELSSSSLGTNGGYNNEYSVSVTDTADIIEATQSNSYLMGNNQYHKPQTSNSSTYGAGSSNQAKDIVASTQNGGNPPYKNRLSGISEMKETGDARSAEHHERHWTDHLHPSLQGKADREPSSSTEQAVESKYIKLNNESHAADAQQSNNNNHVTTPSSRANTSANVTPIGGGVIANFGAAANITPEPSERGMSPEPSEMSVNSEMSNYQQHKKRYKGKHDHKAKHKSGHKSRKEQLKEMQEEIAALQEQLKLKDDEIKTLEESNKTIRQTLVLKDNKIHSLQDEVQHLRMKMNAHNIRAKSVSAVLRPSRKQRASSFSIGKGGKITRTAMLPSQTDYNNRLKQQQQQQYQNGGSPSSSSYIESYKSANSNPQRLYTPQNGLQRAQSENHRKAHSNFEAKPQARSSFGRTTSYQ